MEVIIAAFVKSVIVCFGLATGFAYLTLLERKLIARLQVRYGPNRVGPLGLLRPAPIRSSSRWRRCYR